MNDLKTRFLRATERSCASASASACGSPMAMGFLRRIVGGTTASMSAAREAYPMARSIAASSSASGPIWRRWKAPWSSSSASPGRSVVGWAGVSGIVLPLRGSRLLVGGRIEEAVDRRGVLGLDAVHPRTVRVGVDLLGSLRKRVVRGDHLAGDRRIDVGCGLHRLDHADRLPGLHLAARFRRLDEDDVAELLLGVVGDADAHGPVALALHPLVGLGVSKILRDIHVATPPLWVFHVDENPAVAHERRLHDLGGERLVPHLHTHRVTRCGATRQARERDRARERRREGAARDLAFTAIGVDLLVAAQDSAALLQQEPEELRALAVRFESAPADEIARALEVDRPREPRIEGRDALVHVLAVEVHAGLQPQGVARAQAAGAHAGGHERTPGFGGAFGGEHRLEPVLAGVPGARDHDMARDRAVEGRERLARRAQLPKRVPEARARLRALHRDHRAVAPRRDGDLGTLLRREGFDPGDVVVRGASVHDETEEILAKKVDDEVVDNAARVVQHARIERLPRRLQLVHVVREGVAQERARAIAFHVHDLHVGYVEHARVATHRVVLLDLRPVMDRHVPAAEVHHARARGAMNGIEGGRLQHEFSGAPNAKRGGQAIACSPPLSWYLRDWPLRWTVSLRKAVALQSPEFLFRVRRSFCLRVCGRYPFGGPGVPNLLGL